MKLPRVIPCLLLRNGALVKTQRFRKPEYVGDPINTVRIFNEQGADELIFLDIEATPNGAKPQFDLIENEHYASEDVSARRTAVRNRNNALSLNTRCCLSVSRGYKHG